MDDITRIQGYFARKAKAVPTHRFKDLYSLVWKRSFLEAALDRVLANRGSRSAGVDGISVVAFRDPKYRAKFIGDLSEALKARTFKPSAGKTGVYPEGQR